jgi:hypothetical protein
MQAVSKAPDKKTAHCPECGCVLNLPKGQARSVPQNRRFHALIRAAWVHWPENHPFFHPQSEEHLRKWLTAKAGHCTIRSIDTSDMTPDQAVAAISAAMREAGPYAWTTSAQSVLHVRTPASIAFDELPHKEACKLFDEIAEIIEMETGMKPDELLKAKQI